MALTDTLTKQVGPLPAWGWGAVVVGGYVAYRVVRGGGASAQAAQAGVPVDLGSGGGGGLGASTGQPDTSALQSAVDKLSAALAALQAGMGGSSAGGTGGGSTGGTTGGGSIGGGVAGDVPGVSFLTPTAPVPTFDTSPFSQPGSGAPIQIIPEGNNLGTAVTSGAFAPTPAQLASIVKQGFQGLPIGISYGTPAGAYTVGSVAPSVPVDLTGPSTNTATYLQQLFAIEAGQQPVNPQSWPSEATNPQWRRDTIASLTAAILGSGPAYYGANYGGLTPDQIKAAANWGGPFNGQGTNPVYQTALINAANAVQANPNAISQLGASATPPTVSTQPMTGSPTTPAPSTSAPLMTLSQFNAANRAATTARLNAAKGAQNISTADVNAQIAANYQKYLAAHQ